MKITHTSALPPFSSRIRWTLPMALVSGLGGIPFFFYGKLTGKAAGYANSLACGVMLSASFNLIYGDVLLYFRLLYSVLPR